ncbi:outer membrane protein assembly factor BamD [bacterium]|nr:outer membrane protein assembly factor BamD [bacterium]
MISGVIQTDNRVYRLFIFLMIIIIMSGCSKRAQKEVQDDQFFFDRGMKYMQKKNYELAIKDFQTVVDRGTSDIVDKAQYWLGEAHYKNEDYITAAYEYERVYMDFPSSELAAEAWFKKGMCYFMESPKANLDQENTNLAIDEFNRFIENFPRDQHGDEARKHIDELKEKLAFKDYRNAELYRKMKAYDAALVYYSSVIKDYPRSIWSYYSRYGIGLVHMKLKEIGQKRLKKLNKMQNVEKRLIDDANEKITKEHDLARDSFTLVVNSDTDTSLKKKASQKLSELEQSGESK